MMKRSTYALSALAIGSALIAIEQSKDLIVTSFPSIPLWIFWAAFWMGMVILICSLLLLVFNIGASLAPIALQDFNNFECRPAQPEELPDVHEFAKSFFGDDITRLKDMYSLTEKHPSLFWVIEKVKFNGNSESRKFTGYFCLLPLSGKASELIRYKRLSAADVEKSHIIVEHRIPASVYIGAIAANGLLAKGASLHYLRSHIAHYSRKGVKSFLTRPITEDGVRLVRKHKLIPCEYKGRPRLGGICEYISK